MSWKKCSQANDLSQAEKDELISVRLVLSCHGIVMWEGDAFNVMRQNMVFTRHHVGGLVPTHYMKKSEFDLFSRVEVASQLVARQHTVQMPKVPQKGGRCPYCGQKKEPRQ